MVREVASSPTARVVECFDVVRGERVAVKVLSTYDVRGAGRDALARFEREVRVLATLDHPSVIPLRDYIPEGPAIVLAWMGGGTLEEMLAAGPIAPARAVEVASAILSALGEAHRRGVLHRDVKPANVLFDDAGGARLGDFGVAHLGDLSTTATAGMIGTLAYMSPEQREGRPATLQSDLYGVGMMLREMLTGDRSPAGPSSELRPSAVHRDLDSRHDRALQGLIAVNPSARYVDAFAAQSALLALPWPLVIEHAAPRGAPERAASERPASQRLMREESDESDESGAAMDPWIARPVERIGLSERALARASAFACAADSTLQTVLRVDRVAGEIWLEVPRGRALDRPLRQEERAALRAALDALHRASVVHGGVVAGNIVVDDTGEVTLRFVAEGDSRGSRELDHLALAAID